MKKRYWLGLMTTLFFIVDCDCHSKPDPKTSWIVCTGDTPMLTDGTSFFSTGPMFSPKDWRCPKNTDSPIWAGSGKPAYHNFPPPFSSSKPGVRSAGSSTAYLPHDLLDLPFLALPSASDSSTGCDSTYADVIQVNHDNATVNRISSCNFQLQATIPVATRPLQIAITPDGLTALVTSFDNAVNFIDLASNKVTFTLNTAFDVNPHGIAITPDGARAYMTSFNSDNPIVAVIDLASRKIITTISVASYPQSVYITPDGSQAYVTFPLGGAVYIIDTLTNTVANTLGIQTPRDIAFNSKGTKAYISSASGSPGTIQELNTNTFHVDNVYKVGVGPTDVAVLYGDRYVAVNNYEGKSISLIDVNTGIVQTTPVNGSPVGLSIVR